MSGVDQTERLARIEKDTGNPKDTIYISPSGFKQSYHEDPDCYTLKGGDTLESTRKVAQSRVISPCKHCVLDEVDNRHDLGGISKLERAIRSDKETPEGFEGIAGGGD